MLRDADSQTFNAIYIVCGYTALRYGIDSLVAIIEQNNTISAFLFQTRSFYFVEEHPQKSNVCYGKAMVFSFFTNV